MNHLSSRSSSGLHARNSGALLRFKKTKQNLSQILIREKCTFSNSVRTLNKSELNIAIVYSCIEFKTLAPKHVDIRKQNVGSARCIVGLTASPS